MSSTRLVRRDACGTGRLKRHVLPANEPARASWRRTGNAGFLRCDGNGR